MMIIEEVDLIARDGMHERVPGEPVLLNKLLNLKDGLGEDAEVLFIATTNRPDQIEPTLASRPSRIDQAIELALPDEEDCSELTRLHARGLDVSERRFWQRSSVVPRAPARHSLKS